MQGLISIFNFCTLVGNTTNSKSLNKLLKTYEDSCEKTLRKNRDALCQCMPENVGKLSKT